LKSPKIEAQNEVPHKRAGVDPGGQVALCHNVTKRILEVEISAAPEAV